MNDEQLAGERSIDYSPHRLHLASASISLMLCGTVGGIAAAATNGLPRAIIVFATAIVIVLCVRRAFRLALRANHERILVSNFWKDVEFNWSDVQKVGMGAETMGVMPRPALAFKLRDGRTVRAQATPAHERDQKPIVDQLRALSPPSVSFYFE